MRPADQPYLSLVVTARNDDHGGGFMRRMQAFLNAFIEQCRRHRVPAEVIVVEWNPPADRGPLVEALAWPIEMDWCRVRFIEVPPEIHARFLHSPKQGLYQMIAKNAGIRRAAAEFVLATNIDIFFNDELMQFFAARKLERGKMYRMDRHDAGADFPLWASVTEQLDYCATHQLRLSAREATFPVNALGHRAWPGDDIVEHERIGLGAGWHAPELGMGRRFRHVDDGALIDVPAQAADTVLNIWMDPGAGAGGPVQVKAERLLAGGTAEAVGELLTRRVQVLKLPVPAGTPVRFRLRISGKWKPVSYDIRALMLRVWSVTLGESTFQPPRVRARSLTAADKAAIWLRRKTPGLHAVMAPAYRRAMGMPDPKPLALAEAERHQEHGPVETQPPAFIHTNACGDFTLLHRDHWEDLRGYAEFDAYSMNIDSALCWAAHHAGFREEMLDEPMRIYHMEHGSGWTPEGSEILYNRIRSAGLPWLEYQQLLGWERDMRQWRLPMIFNKGDWGLGRDDLREMSPRPEEAPGEQLWCHADPESPAQLRARAEQLCVVRPVGVFPGWRFDYEWESPEPEVRARRALVEAARQRPWASMFLCPWLEGTRVELDMRGEISRQLIVGGCYDPNEFAWLASVLQPGMTFVDAGANIGLYTLFAAARVGAEGRVIALEPSAREFAALKRNVALNGFTNVTARAVALGESSGEGRLRVAEAGRSGLNSLGDFGLNDVALESVATVPVVALDALVDELGLARVDVMKVDIEGAETAMLRGARRTIERFRPWLLIEASERSLVKLGSSVEEMAALLRGFGYELLAISGATGLPEAWDGSADESLNLIARPAGR